MKKPIILLFFISILLAASFAYALFCPECGTKNIDGAKYCANCGKPIPKLDTSQAPETPDVSNYYKEIIALKDDIKSAGRDGLKILDNTKDEWYRAITLNDESNWRYQLEDEQAARRSNLESAFLSIKTEMSKLNNPPVQYAKAYDLLLELFSIYSNIQSMLSSGIVGYSQSSYTEALVDANKKFDACVDKLEIFLPRKLAAASTSLASQSQQLKEQTSSFRGEQQKTDSRILFDFTEGLQNWEIPEWAQGRPEAVAKHIGISSKHSITGDSGLEVTATFKGSERQYTVVEVMKDFNLKDYSTIGVDIYIPEDAPDGLTGAIAITFGPEWRWVVMEKPVPLTPGKWTKVEASILDGAEDWDGGKDFTPDNNFRREVKKLNVYVSKDGEVSYKGPIYIDNVFVAKTK